MMICNLFTIFDPSTPPLFSLNWLSLIIPILTILSMYWIFPSSFLLIKKIISIQIHKEIKIMLSTSFSSGSTLIFISIFNFILFSNLMGLLPFVFTATSHLLISISIALPVWLTLMIFGWTKNSSHMFSHLIPLGTPPMLSVFMVCVETISNMIRPITLSVRLTANMIAGHLILTLLSSCFSYKSMLSIMLMMPPELLLSILESAVAIIQAYVFMVLVSLYSTEIH